MDRQKHTMIRRPARYLQWLGERLSGLSLARMTSLLFVLGSVMAVLPVHAADAAALPPRDANDWFATHAELRVGIVDRLPFEALTQKAEMVGLAPDLLRSLLVGRNVQIVARPFKDNDDLLNALCAGEIDLALNIAASSERDSCLNFSTSYLEDRLALLGRADTAAFADMQKLARARIGTLRGTVSERILHDRFPHAVLVPLTVNEIVPALTSGRVDVFLGAGAFVDYVRIRAPVAGLSLLHSFSGVNYSFRFAVAAGNNGLLEVLNKGLSRLPDTQRFAIISAWLGQYYRDGITEAPPERIDLTPLEIAYLKSLPPITLGYSPDWEPISFVDAQGRPDGMLNDYLMYFSRTLGIRFEREKLDRWSDIIKAAEQGEVMAVAGVAPGNKDFGQMLFTEPLGRYRLVLVQRQRDATYASPADMAGSRVAVVRSELLNTEVVERLLPGARLIEVNSLKEALTLVEQGSVDACATSLITVDLLIKQRYAGKLKISLALNEALPLMLVLNEHYRDLLPLLNRALQALSESEMRQMRNKWLAPPLDERSSWIDWRWDTIVWALTATLLLALLGYAMRLSRHHAQSQKQAKQTAAEQALLLQAAMDAVPYPMLIMDSAGQLQAVNQAYQSVFRLQRSDVIGKIEVDVVPFSHALRQKLAAARRNVSESGQLFIEELPYTDGKGKECIGQFSMLPLFAAGGHRVSGIIGLLIDVSESRQAYAMAEAAGQRLRDLTENLSVVVFQLHMTVTGELSFTFVSGNAVGLFGIAAQSMMEDERNAMAQVVPEDRERLQEEVRRSAVSLRPARPMFRVNNGAQLIWLAGHIVPRRQADGSIVWNGYWSDITKQHEAASSAASEAAHAASRAKDEFLAMMSHEIRTPMNGVMGLAEVLEDTPLSNDQAGLVKMMRDSAGTMLAILDDILDYSKIEAGHLALSYTAVDLRQLCDQAFGLLAGKAQEKRLQLRIQIDADVAAKHIVDGTRLRQVLFNLLSNAIKFTAHGSIILSMHVAEDGADQQSLRILVEDTGKGISKDQLARLFEPFIQEDSSISGRFGGTGLGLTICRRLMTMMDGDITIDSVENFGSTAQLSLQLGIAERDASMPALRGHRIRLLLPDYNIRMAAQMYVAALGMCVVDDAEAELKLVVSARPGKIELQWSDAHNGAERSLQLNANPLQWSTFRQACLAAVRGEKWGSEVVRSEAAPVQVPAPRKGRILVAEDNGTNQEVIRRFLDRLHFDCDVVSNGVEAFEALKSRNYALLLTDCHMPELDGHALVRHIREIEQAHGLGRMPVVGITASASVEDEQIARDAGMDACLFKPTGLSVLSDCLDQQWPQVLALAAAAEEAQRYQAFSGFQLPGSGPISLLQIKRLEEELGAQGKLTVLRVFRDTLKQDIKSIPEPGALGMMTWLHRMKGAIAVMEFATLIRALEDFCTAVESESAERQLHVRTQFLALCDRAIAQIDRWLLDDAA